MASMQISSMSWKEPLEQDAGGRENGKEHAWA